MSDNKIIVHVACTSDDATTALEMFCDESNNTYIDAINSFDSWEKDKEENKKIKPMPMVQEIVKITEQLEKEFSFWKEKYIKLAELCAENKCKCQETPIEKQARLQREGLGL